MAASNNKPLTLGLLCAAVDKNDFPAFSKMVSLQPQSQHNVNERDSNSMETVIIKVLGKPIVWLRTLLLNPGVNVNARDRRGLTPLMRACEESKREHAKLLTENPDVNADLFDYKNSRSALWYACAQGDLEIVRYLIASGKFLAKTLKGKTETGEEKIPFEVAEGNKERCPDVFNLIKAFYLLPNETTDAVRKQVKPARFFDLASEAGKLYPKEAKALFDLFAEARFYVNDQYAIYNVGTVMVKGQLIPLEEYLMSTDPLKIVSLIDVISAKDERLPFTYGMFRPLSVNKQ